MAHEAVLRAVSVAAGQPGAMPVAAWPTDTYSGESKDVSSNGEAVQLFHQPAANTDGDTIVLFRRSDVVVAGDIFDFTGYPAIDTAKGGRFTGVIAALNRIIDLTVAKDWQEGGTMVIPGQGRVADESDVVEYRDMLTIVRDRIQDMIKKGMTLAQVQAARPTYEYDGRYGSESGPWTTAMFVEAAYKDSVDGEPSSYVVSAFRACEQIRRSTQRPQRRNPAEFSALSACSACSACTGVRRHEIHECISCFTGGVERRHGAGTGIRVDFQRRRRRAATGTTRGPGSPAGSRGRRRRSISLETASVVTEGLALAHADPRKGDYSSVPLSAEGRKVADAWDPSKLAADGCKAYGAAAIMRVPGRLKVAWDNDSTLRIETDAGQQTRLLHFDKSEKPPARSWQGHSAAEWERILQPGGLGVSLQQAPPRIGSLKVVTTNLRAGYLRRNGVPYSEDTVTEYFDASRRKTATG